MNNKLLPNILGIHHHPLYTIVGLREGMTLSPRGPGQLFGGAGGGGGSLLRQEITSVMSPEYTSTPAVHNSGGQGVYSKGGLMSPSYNQSSQGGYNQGVMSPGYNQGGGLMSPNTGYSSPIQGSYTNDIPPSNQQGYNNPSQMGTTGRMK